MNTFSPSRICILLFAFLFVSAQLTAGNEPKKNGKVTTTHANGIKASQGKVKNYKKQGEWKYWDEKGVLTKVENYLNDTLDGICVEAYPNGKVLKMETYRKGIKHGEWSGWYLNGGRKYQYYYLNGSIHGVYKYWHENFILSIDALYENGNIVSRKAWYESGRRFRVETYINSKREGTWIMYHDAENDTFPKLIENYKNDLPHGTTSRFQFGKLIEEFNYYEGKLHGTVRRWNENGVKKSEENYSHGQRNGEFFYWWNGKIIKSGNYLNDEKHGMFKEYSYEGKLLNYTWFTRNQQDSLHRFNSNGKIVERKVILYTDGVNLLSETYSDSGKLITSSTYVNGQRSGVWTCFYQSGSLCYEINYFQNQVNGKYRYWYLNGKQMIEAECVNGVVVKQPRVWNETGKEMKSSTKEYYQIIKHIILSAYVGYDPYRFIPKDDVTKADLMKKAILDSKYDDEEKIVSLPVIQEKNIIVPDSVYTVPEIMPEFPGGNDSLENYLKLNLRYPQLEKEYQKSGTVYVSFIVKSDGSVTDINVVKDVKGAPGFSKEAIRVISKMPQWKPAQFSGHPVSSSVVLPIRFILK